MNKQNHVILIATSLFIQQCHAAASPLSATKQEHLNKALYQAIKKKDVSLATQLLDAKADPNAKKGILNETPLYLALSKGCPNMVKLLLARGADVNAETRHYETPLKQAVYQHPKGPNTQTIVALLIQAGAHISPDNSNLYNLACNTYNQNKDLFPIIAQLIDAGERDTLKKPYGATPSGITRSPARAEFIKAYPGRTLQEKIILSIVLRMCSNDEVTHAQANEQARVLLNDPNCAHEIHRFLPLCLKAESHDSEIYYSRDIRSGRTTVHYALYAYPEYPISFLDPSPSRTDSLIQLPIVEDLEPTIIEGRSSRFDVAPPKSLTSFSSKCKHTQCTNVEDID